MDCWEMHCQENSASRKQIGGGGCKGIHWWNSRIPLFWRDFRLFWQPLAILVMSFNLHGDDPRGYTLVFYKSNMFSSIIVLSYSVAQWSFQFCSNREKAYPKHELVKITMRISASSKILLYYTNFLSNRKMKTLNSIPDPSWMCLRVPYPYEHVCWYDIRQRVFRIRNIWRVIGRNGRS